MWYLYITENENSALYTGITDNLNRRLKEHLSGNGGKYTKSNKPRKLLYVENFDNRLKAINREKQIKKWTKNKKLALIKGDLNKLRELSVSRK